MFAREIKDFGQRYVSESKQLLAELLQCRRCRASLSVNTHFSSPVSLEASPPPSQPLQFALLPVPLGSSGPWSPGLPGSGCGAEHGEYLGAGIDHPISVEGIAGIDSAWGFLWGAPCGVGGVSGQCQWFTCGGYQICTNA